MQPSLSKLQEDVQRYILGQHDHALTHVITTASLSAERRLDIYFNAYRARLIALLNDTYARVACHIGERAFDPAAGRYIARNPATTGSLRDYGMDFPLSLADDFPDDPEIAELARMDLTLRHAFDARDAEILCLEDLATMAPHEWDDIVFTLHPSFIILGFDYNTVAIWQALNDGDAPPAAVLNANRMDWLFWRKDLQPHFRSLDALELAALQGIAQQQSFGQICHHLSALSQHDITPLIGHWLSNWLADGLLSKP